MNEYTRKDFDRDNPAAKDMKSNIAKHKASRNFDKQIAAIKANSGIDKWRKELVKTNGENPNGNLKVQARRIIKEKY